MAKPTQKSPELEALIKRSEAARFQIGQEYLQLKQKLDVPLRIRDSLKSNPLKWLGGSMGAGFLGSFLFRSKRGKATDKVEKKHRGWFVKLLLMLFPLVKPTIKIYATKLLKDYVQGQIKRRAIGKFEKDDSNLY
jgi:hypothetical protein